jgi:hypothetical protein
MSQLGVDLLRAGVSRVAWPQWNAGAMPQKRVSQTGHGYLRTLWTTAQTTHSIASMTR